MLFPRHNMLIVPKFGCACCVDRILWGGEEMTQPAQCYDAPRRGKFRKLSAKSCAVEPKVNKMLKLLERL